MNLWQVQIQPIMIKVRLFQQILNKNLLGLIEHQGEQHFNKNVNWHTETLEQHDKMKKEYCIKNNIQLFEILYNENLEEKLKEILLKLGVDYYRT